jgi:hypothetical protein
MLRNRVGEWRAYIDIFNASYRFRCGTFLYPVDHSHQAILYDHKSAYDLELRPLEHGWSDILLTRYAGDQGWWCLQSIVQFALQVHISFSLKLCLTSYDLRLEVEKKNIPLTSTIT